jgi:hypothetical protein
MVLSVFLVLPVAACGSSSDGGGGNTGGNAGVGGSGAGPSGGGGGPSGSGGAAGSGERAQVRFLYQADWQSHLGACMSISDYRIKFGATPVPVTATIDVTPGALTLYVEVDGRTYLDSDVLHIFTCSKLQTSKQTLQLFGMFGTDLAFAPARKYTVTLEGGVAGMALDP